MATQEELDQEKARADGARISLEFMRRHISDYQDCPESAQKIENFLKANGLPFSAEHLERAFTELTRQGVSFKAEPVEQELPSVPGMKDQIFTVHDIARMPRERYHRLYFGPSAAQFRARVNEIQRRAKEQG